MPNNKKNNFEQVLIIAMNNLEKILANRRFQNIGRVNSDLKRLRPEERSYKLDNQKSDKRKLRKQNLSM